MKTDIISGRTTWRELVKGCICLIGILCFTGQTAEALMLIPGLYEDGDQRVYVNQSGQVQSVHVSGRGDREGVAHLFVRGVDLSGLGWSGSWSQTAEYHKPPLLGTLTRSISFDMEYNDGVFYGSYQWLHDLRMTGHNSSDSGSGTFEAEGPLLRFADTSPLRVNYDSARIKVSVVSRDVEWDISTEGGWFSAFRDNEKVVLLTDTNFYERERTGRIILKVGNLEIDELTITQSANWVPANAVRVIIGPPDAVVAGARWRVNEGEWKASTETIGNLEPGEHRIRFQQLGGWVRPEEQNIVVGVERGQLVVVEYDGVLRVEIEPSGARSADAQWRVNDGPWQNAGDTASGLMPGRHLVSFRSVNGWVPPSDVIVSVDSEDTTEVTGVYEQTGSLQVSLEPAAARTAGAQWRVNDGAWQDSGSTVGNLSPGEHTISFKPIPNRVIPPEQVVTVRSDETASASYDYDDFALWAMGRNNQGQLGDGATTDRRSPVLVRESGVRQISAGGRHSLFVTKTGELWAMGGNWVGQLGDGTTTGRQEPVRIRAGGVVMASASKANTTDFHSLFVTTSGELWGMGNNDYGQLGDGTRVNRHSPVRIQSSGVEQASAGGVFSLFLKRESGQLRPKAMGHNGANQLGDNTTTMRTTPVSVQISSAVQSLSAGGGHSLFLVGNGLYSCGANDFGELGRSTSSLRIPIGIPHSQVKDVFAGGFHSLFTKTNGELWAMGMNWSGQLGDGSNINRQTPVRIRSTGVSSASGGGYHSLFVTESGELWGMGSNSRGQLGAGETAESRVPIRIKQSGVAAASAGLEHSLFLAQPVGSLRVMIEPAEACAAGAQWKVAGSGWLNSGDESSGLGAGTHTVSFKAVPGWNTPPDEIITVEDDGIESQTVYYNEPTTGSITVNIHPDGARNAVAQWRLNDGDWNISGKTVADLPPGTYTVSYRMLNMWDAPAAETVTIAAGQYLTLDREYVRSSASSGSFAQWLADHDLSGTPADIFRQICPVRGEPYGILYTFGTNLPPGRPVLNIRIANGRVVVETPAQDDATVPYVDVRLRGSTNLVDWTLPLHPAQDTSGKPADADWNEPEGAAPGKAFFKLEAELK